MIVLTALYLLCSIIYAIAGITILKNDSKSKLNRIFFVISIDMCLWAFMVTMMNSTYDVEVATRFRIYATFFWSSFYALKLHFFIVLCNQEKLLKNYFSYILLYLPSVITIYLYVFLDPVSTSEIVRVSLGWAYINIIDRGFLFNHFYTINYLSYTAMSLILLWKWGKNAQIRREKQQSKVIMMSLIVVTLLGSITDIVLPNLSIELTPPLAVILILVPVSGIWYSIKKYKLMNLNPQTVLLGVFKIMEEGLVVVNKTGEIIEINNGALKLLGYSENELLNKHIGILFSDNRGITKEEDCSSVELNLIRRDKKPFPVLLSSSSIKDEWGDRFGSVCIFQDLSQIKDYQNKLRRAYDDLEKRVCERTLELRNANIELRNEVKKRIRMEAEIRKLALNDHLTGLPNRRLFNERLCEAIINAEINNNSLAILYLDLDIFKMVNDTFGHSWGDELLKIISTRLSKIIRDKDTIARVGGDEFLILLEGPINENFVKRTAENILNAVRQPIKFNKNEMYITVSIGISMYPQDGKDAETLIKNADIAMYKAKESKNKFEFCDQLMKNIVYEDMKLTNLLYQALEKNEFELHYQPQVNTNTGEIVGIEALLRWNSSEFGMISPMYFIPLAERTGLIVHIGEWVLKTACKQNKLWQDMGVLNVPIAVNISFNQFVSNRLVEQIEGILMETGLDPSQLDLEVTEGVLMKEKDNIISTFEQLKKLGVTISIDDFGIEYSCLNYLKKLPIDKIKIAMEFVNGIGVNEKDEAIVAAMIILGKNLGLKVVAEGVETKEQYEFLKRHGCNEIQGFYYYRPMIGKNIETISTESLVYQFLDLKM